MLSLPVKISFHHIAPDPLYILLSFFDGFPLMAPPENFSRILHDYSEEQKGFIIWKDTLRERLV